MRVLIDECVDQRLGLLFNGHDCQIASLCRIRRSEERPLIGRRRSSRLRHHGYDRPGDSVLTESQHPADLHCRPLRPNEPASRFAPTGSRSHPSASGDPARAGASGEIDPEKSRFRPKFATVGASVPDDRPCWALATEIPVYRVLSPTTYSPTAVEVRTCGTNLQRLSSKTALGMSPIAPKYPVPTGRACRMKNAWTT